ncbi:unnamed protein product [Victoria cruziana]
MNNCCDAVPMEGSSVQEQYDTYGGSWLKGLQGFEKEECMEERKHNSLSGSRAASLVAVWIPPSVGSWFKA